MNKEKSYTHNVGRWSHHFPPSQRVRGMRVCAALHCKAHIGLREFEEWIDRYPEAQRLAVADDYLSLYLSKGLTLEEYYQFEFERRDKLFRTEFLGLREQRYYLEQLNPFKYFNLARNKYLAHKVMEETGIRTAQLYCYYHPEGVVEQSSLIATAPADVCRILQSKGVRQCVVKSTEDAHGDNVLVAEEVEYMADDCLLHCFDGSTRRLTEMLDREPRIFESMVRQSRQFAEFNPSSVNTIRFMTTLYPGGEARVVATFVKIGRAGHCVDNAGGGGNVDVCIDPATGMTQYAIQYDGWRKIKDIDRHPDTGAQLNGVRIERWEELKAEVLRFQQAFPWCKAAGWDIAVTDDGPVVIEVNDMWDRTGQYFIRRGWQPEIRDCYLAWKQSGYKAYRGRLENDFSQAKCQRLFDK